MKKLIITFLFAIPFLSFTTDQSVTEEVVKAFKSANALQVAEYFDDFIDMKLLDKSEVKNMGRNQAGLMLKTFFEEAGISGFEKGSERLIGNTLYMTGKLSSSGKSYNVTVMLKSKANKFQIITLRIN